MALTTSWSRAAAPPGASAVISAGPITTEQADPGGVMCTTRMSGVGCVSASRWNPSFPR